MKSKLSIYLYSFLLMLSMSTYTKVTIANSIVCMTVSSEDICLELYDKIAPITVANFLRYVNSGAYNNSIFHRSVSGFVLQGGGFSLDNTLSLNAIPTETPVINEYQVSNTRGTIAMAKISGNPDSATNQWFINLADNSQNLDNQNGGFTVFGRVIDKGMDVIDKIAALSTYNLGGELSAVPLQNYEPETGLKVDNLIVISNVSPLIEDANSASFQNNYLISVIDAGSLGSFNCKFKLNQINPSYLFTLDLSIITAASGEIAKQGSFDPSTGLLTLPAVKLSETNILNSVILQLTDSTTYTFTLVSINGQVF